MMVIMQMLIDINTAMTIPLILELFRMWYNNKKHTEELEKQKLSAELQYLKNQINPHFFFNTLNNLYSLTLKKSEKAPQMILKLSEIMRYMLIDANHEKVSLENEIDYLNNYINIQKLRFAENSDIQFVVKGLSDKIFIPPLLFIPFVENAFKHGLSKDLKTGFIKIELEVKNKKIEFRVSNNKPEFNPKTENTGIGLINIKKRLELLFPDKYSMHINENSSVFEIYLSISME